MAARKTPPNRMSVPGNHDPRSVRAVPIPKAVLLGAAMNKGVAFKPGRAHLQRSLRPLLEVVAREPIDPSGLIAHRVPLSRALEAYALFNAQTADGTKVVLDPSR